ncbi:MAG: hypothetical protein R3F14_33335 [Polyangiaceae bacterium]
MSHPPAEDDDEDATRMMSRPLPAARAPMPAASELDTEALEDADPDATVPMDRGPAFGKLAADIAARRPRPAAGTPAPVPPPAHRASTTRPSHSASRTPRLHRCRRRAPSPSFYPVAPSERAPAPSSRAPDTRPPSSALLPSTSP